MKRIINTLAVLLSLTAFASCELMKMDNFDGPDAQVSGRLVDAKTGDPIGVETAFSQEIDWANVDWATWTFPTITISKGSLIVNELGWKDKSGNEVYEDQRWFIRFDGQYRNNLIFAGQYKALYKELPCYESDEVFTVKEGDNKIDLKTTPFCRIVDPKVSYDAANKKMVATFYVELGDPSRANTISNVVFAGNTQLFVGAKSFNLAKDDPNAKAQNVNPGELITLEISADKTDANFKNADLFKYATQDRYFRIGAQAEGNGFNTSGKYYNFSPTYKVSADFSTIEEVVWEDVEW